MKNVIIATALFFAAWFILKNKTSFKAAATVTPVAPVATVPQVTPEYYPEPAVLTNTPVYSETPQPLTGQQPEANSQYIIRKDKIITAV